MKRWLALFVLLTLVTSCSGRTVLSGVKGESPCVEYQAGMSWDQISARFGTPDIVPQPEPGTDLSMNARGYNALTVIFYTKRQQVNEDGKIRFKEVIYKIDICKKN
jgi:hypothetical protein